MSVRAESFLAGLDDPADRLRWAQIFNADANERAYERREVDMTFTTKAEIDVDQLDAARRRLVAVVDIVGEDNAGDLNLAVDCLRRACQSGDGGGETYEENLRRAIGWADEAVDYIGEWAEFVKAEWQAGRVRASDDTVVHVARQLQSALSDVAEWADGARRDYRNLD